MKYHLKFEFFGKLLQTTVTADNKHEAMQIVRERINFKEVKAVQPESDPAVDFLMGMFGMKK
jgi:hypothetical protein